MVYGRINGRINGASEQTGNSGKTTMAISGQTGNSGTTSMVASRQTKDLKATFMVTSEQTRNSRMTSVVGSQVRSSWYSGKQSDCSEVVMVTLINRGGQLPCEVVMAGRGMQ